MTEALVIRLNAASANNADATVQWIAVDTTGARHGNVQSGSLSNAAAFAGGRNVIVLVPGTDVYLA